MSQGAGCGPNSRRGVDGIARILAVASGKGGVGKSTVAVNLALALHLRGRRVAILDADIYGPNVPLLLGVRRRGSADAGWAMIELASRLPSELRPAPLIRHGLAVLSLAFLVGEEQAILPQNAPLAGLLARQLLFATDWGERDYLILDLPPGTGEPQATLAADVRIDGVVLVATPQSTALLDTLRSYHLFREAGLPILGRIENMSYLICPNCGEAIDLPRSEAFGGSALADVPVLGCLPFDPAVGQATNTGRPIVLTDEDAEVSRAFLEIAGRIEEMLEKGAED